MVNCVAAQQNCIASQQNIRQHTSDTEVEVSVATRELGPIFLNDDNSGPVSPTVAANDDACALPQDRCFVDSDTFLESVDREFVKEKSCGIVACIELQDDHSDIVWDHDNLSTLSDTNAHYELFMGIESVVRGDGIFCWLAGRILIFLDQTNTSRAHRLLRQIGKNIASIDLQSGHSVTHFTPAIGFVNIRFAKSSAELWGMAEAALVRAKSSLEIEPCRYLHKSELRSRVEYLLNPTRFWGKVPQWAQLSTQLLLTLILGLGAPFILYAVCDALGADISGPVYIGVVVVLVVTAATIWIEGFLALKPTNPPSEPGSPYPVATIIIPAYLPNEAATIVETVNAFLRLDYANTVQIIIAYNAPMPYLPVEGELAALAAREARHGRFLIEPIRVAGSTSKAQNVNAVIGRVKGRFVGIFDADHHPHPDSLQRAWRWLSNGWDIVQGRCSIRNGEDSWVSRMVAVEFEQIYAVSHPGRARFHGFGIFGGSNGFWRTSVLHETRMRHSMLTEDIDSSIRAVVAGYKIAGDRDLISEELAPTSMHQLLNQRLRWAQGWFQVSFRRVVPALMSPRVTIRQKLGLIHLLVWRELFPWYSIQVVPIMAYWVWVYGWDYIQWTIPIFLLTTIFTVSTGPGQLLFAYFLAQKSMQRRPGWFIEYLFVSMFFYSPFKDALSRIAHIKEAMRERAWKVTPRTAPVREAPRRLVHAAAVALFLLLVSPASGLAQTADNSRRRGFSLQQITTLLGGEAATIHAARTAAKDGRNVEAARLFAKAIADVPGRRRELLPEYAKALTYSNNSGRAVPLYRELLSLPLGAAEKRDALSHFALALTWSGQHRAALVAYDHLVTLMPGDAATAVRRARVLTSLGRPEDAIAALDRVSPAKWATGPLATLGDEILVDAARSAAKAGQTAAAGRLYDRAARHNATLRASLQREHADQSAAQSAATAPRQNSIAAYRTALSSLSPGTADYRNAQRGLAVALTRGGASRQALDAWTTYLRSSPGDVDAMINQARMFSALRENGKAFNTYKAAYAIDLRSVVARRGIIDETVNLARIAAREDRNVDSAALFAGAIKLDGGKRNSLLREYADQLSFGGRPAEAIPLYLEVLSGPALSAPDHKQASVGLANAYAWAGRSNEALTAYTQLASNFPEDTGLQWTKVVFAARQAAQTNRNAEAVKLFAQAIQTYPDRRTEILREYADQLTFTDQAARAIPLYSEVLAQPDLIEADQWAARKGLAQAYDWSGRFAEAKPAYDALIAKYPNEPSWRWNLLVVSAREAAQADRNKDAARLFAQAIKLSPDHSIGILREYADQLSFTGRAANAIGFYTTVLAQSAMKDADRLSAQKGLAQAYDWSGRFTEAKASYAALSQNNPGDVSLRWQLLVVSGREAAKADMNKEAAVFFDEAIRLVPARRMSVLKEYADKLTFSGNAKQAIPLYRELVAQGQPTVAVRSYELSLAQALAWNDQLGEALPIYKRLAAADAGDIDALNGVARILSWGGNQPAAKIAYQQVLVRDAKNAEAQRGIAQAEMWQGHQQIAQRLLGQRLKQDPNDLEARRLLAQSQLWSGRPDKARSELQVAMRERRPASPDRTAPQVEIARVNGPTSGQRGPQVIDFQPDRQARFPR